jgi:hypothetical protein
MKRPKSILGIYHIRSTTRCDICVRQKNFVEPRTAAILIWLCDARVCAVLEIVKHCPVVDSGVSAKYDSEMHIKDVRFHFIELFMKVKLLACGFC